MSSSRMGSRPALLVAVALAASLVAGCSSNSGSQSPTTTTTSRVRYPDVNYSYVWSADSGVDLVSRPAELVRASFEAWLYSYYVGTDQSYPGFEQAASKAVAANDPNIDNLLTLKAVTQPEKPYPHTTFAHIAGFSATDTDVSAIVCRYDVAADPTRAPKPETWLSRATVIHLKNTTSNPGRAGIPDTDPDHPDPRAHIPPTWDVFSPWDVTELKGIWPKDIPSPSCTNWWHDRFPEFVTKPDGTLDAPPNWVPPTMPVGVQYPDWIGPSPQ